MLKNLLSFSLRGSWIRPFPGVETMPRLTSNLHWKGGFILVIMTCVMQTTDQRPLTKHIFKTSKGENLYYEKTDNIPGCIIHCSIYCIHGFSGICKSSRMDGRKRKLVLLRLLRRSLTDTWKKSGNDWYYLNADGVRAYSNRSTNTM